MTSTRGRPSVGPASTTWSIAARTCPLSSASSPWYHRSNSAVVTASRGRRTSAIRAPQPTIATVHAAGHLERQLQVLDGPVPGQLDQLGRTLDFLRVHGS